MSDTDAAAYIAAVETADGQSLPGYVSAAIDAFVVGAKADGFWAAIKAACFLAGPRTLAGALTPLVGASPTNFNFVADDYNETTGLKANGESKELDSNRNNTADPQNSQHVCVWVSELATITSAMFGDSSGNGSTRLGVSPGIFAASRSSGSQGFGAPAAGFLGISRSGSSATIVRNGGNNQAYTNLSQAPKDANQFIFSNSGGLFSDARIAWYSIGENLLQADLDARLTTYMAAVAAGPSGPSGSPRRRRMMMMQRGGL